MELIITTEDRLTSIIRSVLFERQRTDTPVPKVLPGLISGSKNASKFINDHGYTISNSLFSKEVAKGNVKCRRFHNKRLIFEESDLLAWAESLCIPLEQSNATLLLAASAGRKLKKGGK